MSIPKTATRGNVILHRLEKLNLLINRNIETFDQRFGSQTVSVGLLKLVEIICHGRVNGIIEKASAGNNKTGDHHNSRGCKADIPLISDVLQFCMRELMGKNKGDHFIVISKKTFGKVNIIFKVNPCVGFFIRVNEKLCGLGNIQASDHLVIYGNGTRENVLRDNIVCFLPMGTRG